MQIVYYGCQYCSSIESEFSNIDECKQYLKELRGFAKKLALMHGFSHSCIEIVDRDSLEFQEYLLALSISDIFI